jgi:hypothetical protein
MILAVSVTSPRWWAPLDRLAVPEIGGVAVRSRLADNGEIGGDPGGQGDGTGDGRHRRGHGQQGWRSW